MPINIKTSSDQPSWFSGLSPLLFRLWPLVLLLVFLLVGAYWLWQVWPSILVESIGWQKQLHQQMSGLLQQVSAAPGQAGLALMLFSLGYGVLHALGPGHGKIVIITYLATHPAKLKSSLQLTVAASLVQGLVAVALVTLVLVVLQLSSRQLHQSSFWLEKGSFILVSLVGLGLILRALTRLWRAIKIPQPIRLKIKRAALLPQGYRHGVDYITHNHGTDDHDTDDHSTDCGCGHRHLPSEAELLAGNDWRTKMAIVLAMGMRPCSGAILVLLFSKVIGVFTWGIISAMAMALGTSLTISLLALLVHYSRKLAQRLSRQSAPAAWHKIAWSCLALMGGIILLFAGVLLYASAQPELGGSIRPFMR